MWNSGICIVCMSFSLFTFQEIVLCSSSYFSYIGLFDSLSLPFLNPRSIQNHVFFICKQSLTNECYPQVLWKNVFCLRQLAKEIHKQDIVSTSRHPKRIAPRLTASERGTTKLLSSLRTARERNVA